jgi:hypothetical protein
MLSTRFKKSWRWKNEEGRRFGPGHSRCNPGFRPGAQCRPHERGPSRQPYTSAASPPAGTRNTPGAIWSSTNTEPGDAPCSVIVWVAAYGAIAHGFSWARSHRALCARPQSNVMRSQARPRQRMWMEWPTCDVACVHMSDKSEFMFVNGNLVVFSRPIAILFAKFIKAWRLENEKDRFYSPGHSRCDAGFRSGAQW